jgi:hypothetical protein
MKNVFLFYVLGICLFLGGCEGKIYRCEYAIPVDLEEYVPDMKGMTFVYKNASNDTTIELVGHELRTSPPAPYEWEDDGAGFSCESGRTTYFARPGDDFSVGRDIVDVYFMRSVSERFSSIFMELEFCKIFSPDFSIRPVFCRLNATFDEQGHFVTRDFGDTLLLTDPRMENPDTALWVRGLGMIRLNDFYLVSVTDSTGAVLYQAEAQQ